MRRFEHPDMTGRTGIAIAGDNHALQRTVPETLESCRQLGGPFPGADYDSAALRPFRQMLRKSTFGIRSRNRGMEERAQYVPILRRHRATSATKIPSIPPSSSATTRAPRPGEQDGREYFFRSREAFDEAVFDRLTGEPLRFEVVSGAEAQRSGLPEADLDTDYIRVHLPRPAATDGGVVEPTRLSV